MLQTFKGKLQHLAPQIGPKFVSNTEPPKLIKEEEKYKLNTEVSAF